MFSTAWKPVAAIGAAAVALVSVITPTSAIAGPDLRATFASFDKNGDGSVTLDEFRSGHPADRLITPSGGGHPPSGPVMIVLRKDAKPPEGAAAPAEMLRANFQRQDSNGNGAVDFVEFEAFHRTVMKEAFGTADADKNGAIAPAELAALGKYLPAGAPQPDFARLDANKDGGLSEDEYFAQHH